MRCRPRCRPRDLPSRDTGVDVAEQQNQALIALDDAMEARHAETETHADARAARADNRAAWGVTFAGLAALVVVIEFFFR